MLQYTTEQAITVIAQDITPMAFRLTARRLGVKPVTRDPITGQNLWSEDDVQTIKTYRETSPGPGNRTAGVYRRGGPRGTRQKPGEKIITKRNKNG